MKSYLKWAFLAVVFPAFLSAQGIRSKVNTGNEQYHAGDYEQALSNYKDALLDDPLNEKILFNQADALFKMEKYEEAREEYQKILATKDMQLAAQAHYNIGNTYFKENKLPESIDSYKRSLELNPDDFEAKYNLELARAKLKEQSEKQQQDQQQQQQNQQQQDQQQQQQNQENKEQQEEEQQQQQQQEQQAEEQQGQQQQMEQNEDEISKEEAERILNALKEDEQEAQKNKAPVKVRGRRADKDW